MITRLQQRVLDLDTATSGWAVGRLSETQLRVVRAVTHLGGTEVVATTGAVIAGGAAMRRRSLAPLLHAAVVVGGQNLVYNLAKRIIDRRRPDGPHLAPWTGASFPSGHTATAAAAWPAYAEIAGFRPRSVVGGGALLAGPIVGTTRVLLGVHWMSDVLAGLALGWSWLAVVRALRSLVSR